MLLDTASSEHLSGRVRNESKHALLIIDDNPLVSDLLMRLLKHSFDTAFTATTPAAAERILAENTITHVLSDDDFGPGVPRGTELIVGWRRRYPWIERVLLLSGSTIFPCQIPDEVDEFFGKGEDFRNILKALKP